MNARGRNRPSRRDRAGFTIVELIAAIIIAGIMAAVAFPIMSNMGENREKGAARLLLRDLAYAREHAMATGTTTWVVIDAAAETWSLYEEDPSNPGAANRVPMKYPASEADFIQDLDADYPGVTISAAIDGNDEIGFDWQGAPLNESEAVLAAKGWVYVSGANNISIAMSTGYAQY